MAEPIKTDLTEKLQAVARLNTAVNRYFQQTSAFGPGTPPTPQYGEEDPHLYEYQPGVNLITTPRAGHNVLPFYALRALATASKEIRLNIELIKRQVRGLEWEIVPSRKEEKQAAVMVNGVAYDKTTETQSVVEFFEFPDGVTDFDAWINMLIEELLVTDAVTLYPNSPSPQIPRSPADFNLSPSPQIPRSPAAFGGTEGGKVILELIDGTTIRPLVDMRGRTPQPPAPAYLQILQGIASTHYPANSLLYRPLNTKVYTPYGESPIEWVLTAINTAIRKDAQKISYFTEGNVPNAIIFTADMPVDQVRMMEEYYNALLQGDIGRANRMILMPGQGGANPVYQFAQNNQDNVDVDKYLMQVACWAFGNNPAEFGLIPGEGLGGKGFMQGNAELQMRSMVWPITGYLFSLFNLIIRKYLRRPDLKFQWVGLNPAPDQLSMAQVDQLYTQMGAYSLGYVQDRLGVPQQFRPAQPPANPMFGASFSPPIPRSPAAFGGTEGSDIQPFINHAIKVELNQWREKALRALKKKWPVPDFKSDILPADLRERVRQGLAKAATPAEINTLFASAVPQEGNGQQQPFRLASWEEYGR